MHHLLTFVIKMLPSIEYKMKSEQTHKPHTPTLLDKAKHCEWQGRHKISKIIKFQKEYQCNMFIYTLCSCYLQSFTKFYAVL